MILLAGMNIVFCTVNGTCTGEVTRKPMVEWSRSRPFSIQQNQDYLKILLKDSGKASESLNYFCQYRKVLEQSSEISRLWFSVTLRMFLPVLVKRCVVNARFWQQKGKKDICSSRSGELHYCVCVCVRAVVLWKKNWKGSEEVTGSQIQPPFSKAGATPGMCLSETSTVKRSATSLRNLFQYFSVTAVKNFISWRLT